MKLFKHAVLSTLLIASLVTSAQAMTTMGGKPVTMEQLVGKGKWTAINIWSYTCGICRATAHHMVDIDTSLPNVQVYGISVDDKEGKAQAQKFIQEHQFAFPNMVSDVAEVDTYIYKTAKETLMGTPTMLLFSPKGKLVAVQPGPVSANELQQFMQRM